MDSCVMFTITGLFNYPIKSAQGHSHKFCRVIEQGLVGDREWMIVDRNGVFVTQRQHALIATIRCVPRGEFSITLEHDVYGATHAVADASHTRDVRVWDDVVPAFDGGDDAAVWLSSILGCEVRLMRYADPFRRYSSRKWSGNSGAHTRFADGFSVLVTNAASLANLNEKMARPLPMDRFRPNVVIDGIAAWDEDYVDTLRADEVVLKLVKPCVRCITTTTDQASGTRRSDEPLTSLSRFRNNPDIGGPTFGVNAIVIQPGILRVGETFTVEHRF